MRTLITGGAGFIGSHLCERFLAEGHDVVCLDNFITGNPLNIQHLQGNPRFTFLRHNISNQIQIDGPLDNILHFASPASPVDYLRHPIPTLKVGSLGTHNSLGLAKAKNARFLLASTSEVYGDPERHPQREDYWGNVNPIGMRGVYDEAKRFAEAMTMAYHRSHGINTHIIRIFNTYGPRMRLDDGRVVPNLMGQALRGEPLTVYGDGSQTRSFCYVSDLVEGIYPLAVQGLSRAGQSRQSQRSEHPRFRQGDRRLVRQPRARSSSSRCRRTIRRCASPTSRGPGHCSGGNRRWSGRRG